MTSAWDVGLEALVAIREGEADALRDACLSGRLICPIARCTAPRITTRRRYVNRWGTVVVDAFRHVVAPADGLHSAESIRHADCKAAVKSWLDDLGFTSVRTERPVSVGHRPASGGHRARVRRPDVQGKHPGGREVAVEVQVSSITEGLWRARTLDLERGGRTALWIWCWERGDRQHALTTALRFLVASGREAWFLDPYAESGPSLGWAHQVAVVDGEEFRVQPFDLSSPLEFEWYPLSAMLVSGQGEVVRPGGVEEIERFKEAQAREEERDAKRRRADEARMARRRYLKNDRDWRPAPASRVSREERQAAQRRLSDARSSASTSIEVEEACSRVNRRDDLIWLPVIVWKRDLAAWLLQSTESSLAVSVDEVVAQIEVAFPCSPGTTRPAALSFLRDLVRAGVVHMDGDALRKSGI